MLNRVSDPEKLVTEKARHPLKNIGIRMEVEKVGTYFKRMKLIEPFCGLNFKVEILAKYTSKKTDNVAINKEEYFEVKKFNMPVLFIYSDIDGGIPNKYIFMDNANINFIDSTGIPMGLISINQFKDTNLLENEIKELIERTNKEKQIII